MIREIIANFKHVFSLKLQAESDVKGILNAGFVIMWTGVTLLAFTGLKQIINILVFHEATAALMTITNLIDLVFAICVLLMGAALVLYMKVVINKKEGLANAE